MSDQKIPFGDKPSDTAVLLLAAASALNLDARVVRTGAGVFYAPAAVVKKAFPPKKDSTTSTEDKPAKKSAAKK